VSGAQHARDVGIASSSATPTQRGLIKKRRVGRYDLVAKLASGGMATVYLGEVRGVGGFQKPVAVKICHEQLRDDPEFHARFLDEARLAARIRHPNVVSTLDVSDEDGLFLVMEWVEGGRVSDLCRAQRALNLHVPLEIAARVAVDTLNGLHGAHATADADGTPLHVVHRDISPQNILVATDGITRVVDFGIAKAESRAAVTADNSVRGKAGYMAPEQIAHDDVDHRADLFSFAVVLWEMLAGERLFQRDSQAATMEAVARAPIPSLRSFREDVPEALAAAIERALRRDPAERFESALAFADAIEAAVRPASARVVAAFVDQLLGAKIRAIRALLHRIEPPPREIEPPAPLERDTSPRAPSPPARRRWAGPLIAVGVSIAIGCGAYLVYATQDAGGLELRAIQADAPATEPAGRVPAAPLAAPRGDEIAAPRSPGVAPPSTSTETSTRAERQLEPERAPAAAGPEQEPTPAAAPSPVTARSSDVTVPRERPRARRPRARPSGEFRPSTI
jgi:serine/threonine protein kinase